MKRNFFDIFANIVNVYNKCKKNYRNIIGNVSEKEDILDIREMNKKNPQLYYFYKKYNIIKQHFTGI